MLPTDFAVPLLPLILLGVLGALISLWPDPREPRR
jgi:hypothetical protein